MNVIGVLFSLDSPRSAPVEPQGVEQGLDCRCGETIKNRMGERKKTHQIEIDPRQMRKS